MLRILISVFEKGFAKHTFNSEKINFDVNETDLPKTFTFEDTYLSLKKLSKFWHFVSLWASIPRSMCFKGQ